MELIRRVIQITKDQDAALRKLSATTGDSISSLIRRAVAEFLARQ